MLHTGSLYDVGTGQEESKVGSQQEDLTQEDQKESTDIDLVMKQNDLYELGA